MRAEEALTVGPLELKLHACRALWKGADVGLTLTEYKIVHLLVTNLGSHLTYREVHENLHHVGFISRQRRGRLSRQCAGLHQAHPQQVPGARSRFACIANYPSFGYRWMVDPLPPSS
jgi:two-component system response regulator ChvI